MIYNTAPGSHATELAKLLVLLQEKSGLNPSEWREKLKINSATHARLTSIPANPTTRVAPYYRALKNYGAKVVFMMTDPGSFDPKRCLDYTDMPTLADYLGEITVGWMKRNHLRHADVASIIGTSITVARHYLNTSKARSTPEFVIRDFELAGLTTHVDVIHPDIDATMWELTIPESVRPVEPKAVPTVLVRDPRRVAAFEFLNKIYKEGFEGIDAFALALGTNPMHARNYINSYGTNSFGLHAYTVAMDRLGALVSLTVKINGKNKEIPYSIDPLDIAEAFSEIFKEYVESSKIGASAMAKKLRIDLRTLKNRLHPTRGSTPRMEGYLDIFEAAGIPVTIDVTHQIAGRYTQILTTADTAKPTVCEDSEETLDATAYCSERQVADMMRGKTKTSLGETVRAFL